MGLPPTIISRAFSGPHHARQALGAPRTGAEPELDLGGARSGRTRPRPGNGRRGAVSSPPPRAVPWTAATTGFGASSRTSIISRKPGASSGLLNSVMSAPAMNVRPAQASTMPVTSALATASRMVSQIPWRTCRLRGVDGGVVDGDDGNAVTYFELNGVRFRGHEGSRADSLGGSAPARRGSYHSPPRPPCPARPCAPPREEPGAAGGGRPSRASITARKPGVRSVVRSHRAQPTMPARPKRRETGMTALHERRGSEAGKRPRGCVRRSRRCPSSSSSAAPRFP